MLGFMKRTFFELTMERALVLELVRVTEQAALQASYFVGKGDKIALDAAGTQAMRQTLSEIHLSGTVVIGEGEMDEAPMLYIGEKVGLQSPESFVVDIAVDPVEGTTVAARGLPNSVAVIALSEKNGLLGAPDMYMEKLVVTPPAVGKVNLEWNLEANLSAIAQSLERSIADLTIVVLDRPRHENLIGQIRASGARVKLIGDGDVIAALAVATRGTGGSCLNGVWGRT
jgi:fructose-1,6-bisphosphatase II